MKIILTNTEKIALSICHIVAVYQILFGYKFEKIKEETGVEANSLAKLIQCIII